MATIFCDYHGSRSGLIDLIHQLSNAVALGGGNTIPADVVRGIHLRMGVTLLSKIQQNFVVLSRGGTSEAGYRWKPLERKTIAARRISNAGKKALGITGKRERGLLTPTQNTRWKRLYSQNLTRFILRGMAEGAAKSLAAAIAWNTLKAEGAQTKLQVYGSRTVDIGRDTGILFRSLTPGIEDKPSNADQQIFQVVNGFITVGTNVPYASAFHKHRPLWPDKMPNSWMDAINAAASRGVALALVQMIERQ